MEYDIVFSGASSKIPVHAGALKAIKEHDIPIRRVAGSSAGSIIAACIAFDMGYEDIEEIIFNINFSKVIRNQDPWYSSLLKLIFLGYWNTGDKLLEILQDVFGTLRFKDLKKNLYVAAHELDEWETFVFSKETTPGVYVVDALRASASLPFAFEPYKVINKKFIDGSIGKDILVDYNPIGIGTNIICNLIESTENATKKKNKSYIDVGLALMSQVSDQNVSFSLATAGFQGKKVYLTRSFYKKSPFDFKVGKKEKEKMIEVGYSNMSKMIVLNKIGPRFKNK